MNTSELQSQFPLSPRKFWKKMIEKLVPGFVFGGFLAILLTVVYFLVTSTGEKLTGPVPSILLGLIGFILFIMLVVALVYAWYLKEYIRRYYYAGEEHFITIKKGFFAPTEIHVQWQKIQDVYVDQDILDRVMGLYDVHIASATATSGIEAHIDGVDKAAAEGLKKFLLSKVSSAGNGGTGASVAGAPQGAAEAMSRNGGVTGPIRFSEEISNKTYPFFGKWVVLSTCVAFFTPFLYWGLFIGYAGVNFAIKKGIHSLFWFVLAYVCISTVSGIVQASIAYIWRRNYAFSFDTDTLYYRKGVISISEKHMPYSSIQDVTISQGVAERFLGIASVNIENAAQGTIQLSRGRAVPVPSGIALVGLELSQAQKIADLLKTTVLGRANSRFGL